MQVQLDYMKEKMESMQEKMESMQEQMESMQEQIECMQEQHKQPKPDTAPAGPAAAQSLVSHYQPQQQLQQQQHQQQLLRAQQQQQQQKHHHHQQQGAQQQHQQPSEPQRSHFLEVNPFAFVVVFSRELSSEQNKKNSNRKRKRFKNIHSTSCFL